MTESVPAHNRGQGLRHAALTTLYISTLRSQTRRPAHPSILSSFMQYSSSFSRSLPSPAGSLPPLSDGDSATLSDSTNDDPQDQLGYLGTSSLALSAILDPKFPHSAEVFGNWLKTLYIRGFIEDSTYSRIRVSTRRTICFPVSY